MKNCIFFLNFLISFIGYDTKVLQMVGVTDIRAEFQKTKGDAKKLPMSENAFIGKWTMVSMKFKGSDEETLGRNPHQVKFDYWRFSKDGKFSMKIATYLVEGIWKYDGSGSKKVLTLSYGGSTSRYIVQKLASNAFTIEAENVGSIMTFKRQA